MAGMGTGFSKCFILFMAIVILVSAIKIAQHSNCASQ